MKTDDWQWWVGHDDERYHTCCGNSRAEAVRIASEEQDGGYIVEAIQPSDIRLSGYFDATAFLENAEELAYEDCGDPEGDIGVFEVGDEQAEDLQVRVREAIEAWQESHALKFRGWQFSDQRNAEYIEPVAESK